MAEIKGRHTITSKFKCVATACGQKKGEYSLQDITRSWLGHGYSVYHGVQMSVGGLFKTGQQGTLTDLRHCVGIRTSSAMCAWGVLMLLWLMIGSDVDATSSPPSITSSLDDTTRARPTTG